MSAPGLGPCGSRLGGLVVGPRGTLPEWPPVQDILANKQLEALLQWRHKPAERPPKRQTEKEAWVSTPGRGSSKMVDFVKKRKRIAKLRLAIRKPSQLNQWPLARMKGYLPPRHRHKLSPRPDAAEPSRPGVTNSTAGMHQ